MSKDYNYDLRVNIIWCFIPDYNILEKMQEEKPVAVKIYKDTQEEKDMHIF